jgi:hypothetical protein
MSAPSPQNASPIVPTAPWARQTHPLTEADFRGDHPHDLKGNNDLLALTRPDIIDPDPRRLLRRRRRHRRDQHLQLHVHRPGRLPTRVHRHRAQHSPPSPAPAAPRRQAEAATPGRRCFVAGAIGPLNRTLSMSPDVNRPDYRAVTWDQVVAAYTEQIARSSMPAWMRCSSRRSSTPSTARPPSLRSRASSTRRGESASRDDLRHDHRRLRPHALGPDHRRVLSQHPPRAALLRGHQLRARRRRDAPYVEELAAIAECYVTLLPECRPAQCLRRLRRDARRHGRRARRVRRATASSTSSAAAAAPRPRTSRAIAAAVKAVRPSSPRHPRRPRPPPQRPRTPERPEKSSFLVLVIVLPPFPRMTQRTMNRSLIHPIRLQLHRHRRAHQHHRLAEVRQGPQGRRLGRLPRHRQTAGRERRQRHRHQRGRGADRRRGDDGEVPQPHRRRARHLPRAR